MIPIRLLNGSVLYVNAELVETVSAAHDTIITLTSGRKILSSTRPEELLEAVIAYRQRIRQPAACGGAPHGLDAGSGLAAVPQGAEVGTGASASPRP